MNKKLTINRKYLIIDILFSILFLVFFILFLYFCIIDFNIVLLLGSIFMFIFALFFIITLLFNYQVAKIIDDKIIVYNLLGKVNEIDIKDIKKVFYKNVFVTPILKMISIYKDVIILHKKDIKTRPKLNEINNRKKYNFIIILDTIENRRLIKDEYKRVTGNNLEI